MRSPELASSSAEPQTSSGTSQSSRRALGVCVCVCFFFFFLKYIGGAVFLLSLAGGGLCVCVFWWGPSSLFGLAGGGGGDCVCVCVFSWWGAVFFFRFGGADMCLFFEAGTIIAFLVGGGVSFLGSFWRGDLNHGKGLSVGFPIHAVQGAYFFVAKFVSCSGRLRLPSCEITSGVHQVRPGFSPPWLTTATPGLPETFHFLQGGNHVTRRAPQIKASG